MVTAKRYFVGHQLSLKNIQDLRGVIEPVFKKYDCDPYYADREIESQSILLKVCQKIYATDFGIFDITTPSINVLIEIGIALAFNKKILVISREDTSIPLSLLGHVNYYPNLCKLPTLLEKLAPYMLKRELNLDKHCYFCNQSCEGLTAYPDKNTYLILDKSGLLGLDEWQDLRTCIEDYLNGQNLQSVSLQETSTMSRLCNIRKKVLSTQFSICHLGRYSDLDTFIAFGMAVGYCRPWLILSEVGDSMCVPSNLHGIDRIEYATIKELSEKLRQEVPSFLAYFYTTAKAGTEVIQGSPFWFSLGDWIERTHSAPTTGSLSKGDYRVIKISDQGLSNKFLITKKGLTIGRDSKNDIVIQHSMVSDQHARIFKQDSSYYLHDTNSTNGTFYDGRQLAPGEVVRIEVGKTFHVAHVERYLIWDDNPLPFSSYQELHQKKTGKLSLVEITLPDEVPPKDFQFLSYTVLLTVRGKVNGVFEIQSYYRMGEILKWLGDKYKFDVDNHCFSRGISRGTQLVREDKSPLELIIPQSETIEIIKFEDLVFRLFASNQAIVRQPENGNINFLVEREINGEDETICVVVNKLSKISDRKMEELDDFSKRQRLTLFASEKDNILMQLSGIAKDLQTLRVPTADWKVNKNRRDPKELELLQVTNQNALNAIVKIENICNELDNSKTQEDRHRLEEKLKKAVLRIKKTGKSLPNFNIRSLIIVASETDEIPQTIKEKADQLHVNIMNYGQVYYLLEEGMPLT